MTRTATIIRFSRLAAVAAALAVAAAIAVAVAPAASAANAPLNPGGYIQGELFCRAGQVEVWSPTMRALYSGGTVAFVDTLLWWNGSSWQPIRNSAAFSQTQSYDIFTAATSLSTNYWVSGGQVYSGNWVFTGLPHGYYAVRQTMAWSGAANQLSTLATVGYSATYCGI